MGKENDTDKKERYVRNIRQSSDRMREMLNTLLSFFRLDNGKEQPNFSPCRISAITYILETEFTPIAMNKELALTVTNYTDVKVYSFLFITRVRDKDCVKNRVKRAKIVRFTLC